MASKVLGKAAERLVTDVAGAGAVNSVSTSQALSGLIGNTSSQMVTAQLKNRLMSTVLKSANRPNMQFSVVSTVAFEGIRADYLRLCDGDQGGLVIVYEKHGMGKSHALQGVARAKSMQQPHRFFVINILNSTKSCDELYQCIQTELGVANMGLVPDEVAEVARYGLLGPTTQSQETLPATSNKCRLSIDSAVRSAKKETSFPIFVID